MIKRVVAQIMTGSWNTEISQIIIYTYEAVLVCSTAFLFKGSTQGYRKVKYFSTLIVGPDRGSNPGHLRGRQRQAAQSSTPRLQ
jgi:hypothetical protein